MLRRRHFAAMAVAAAAGAGTAVATAAGDDGVRACAVKKTGEIRATSGGKCAAGSFAITISGDAFKGSRGGTLTINGVAFKKGSGKTITINGTAFKSSGQTLTINGTAFKSSGKTLTINGTAFAPGEAARIGPTGPPGGPGPQGAQGAAGADRLTGAPAAEASAPQAVAPDSSKTIVSSPFTNGDGKAHRLLLTGGLNTVCNPCADPLAVDLVVTRTGESTPLVVRTLRQHDKTDRDTATLSEIVVTPDVCGPCTFNLAVRVGPAGASGQPSSIDVGGARFGIVDLGPA